MVTGKCLVLVPEAAGNFFNQQQELQGIQKQDVALRRQQDQALNVYRQQEDDRAEAAAQFERNRPTFAPGTEVKIKNKEDGTLHYAQHNPKTGVLEDTGQQVPESEKWSQPFLGTDGNFYRVNQETNETKKLGNFRAARGREHE